jgi:hypothetical protein
MSRRSFYRVFSLANGGRVLEADLFEGLAGCGVSTATTRLAG